jgi:hypothetical protein
VTWHLALFAVWAAGAIPTAFFVGAGIWIFHNEDHLCVSPRVVARGVIAAAGWPVFWAWMFAGDQVGVRV